jgi:shikimate kinase
METADGARPLRILFVGFMGSGKSTVGRIVAQHLGWRFIDFDDVIEERIDLTIAEIFRERGEPFFRQVEEEVGQELLRLDHVVLASGGGWPVPSGRLEGLPEDSLSVWLRVSPEEAVRRMAGEGSVRPLLEGPDPVTKARELLEVREGRYTMAHLTLDTEGAEPQDLALSVLDHIDPGK